MPARTIENEPSKYIMSKEKLLVFLPTDPNEKWIAKIQTRYPGLEVRWARSIVGGKAVPASQTPAEYWEKLTLLCVSWFPPPAELTSTVKYVQVTSSGLDHWRGHPTYENPDITFCNGNGLSPPQIAEWVIGAWLANQHQFFRYRENMHARHWETTLETGDIRDSVGLRMGILGYGAIGRQVARLASALGMEIFAYTRSPRTTASSRHDHGFTLPGTGDPDGELPARWFHGSSRADINSFLAQDLDLLVISLPLSDDTRHLLAAEQFEVLSRSRKAQGKPGTFLANIARGAVVHTEALVAALETGQIRGAALDVTDPEPLPREHPLWSAPNVFITPHVSWVSTNYWDRTLQILEENLERLSSGRRCINEVKPK